jgi:hypothetical protein
MPTRTPEQKLARKIQAATGDAYLVCLMKARALIANQKPPKES